MMPLDQESAQESLFWVDSSRCIGCFSCEVACKMEHDLPPGPRPIRVIQVGPLQSGEELSMTFQPVTCNHCASPRCAAACPTTAMSKNTDNVVRSDLDLCIGCLTCAIACPFGIPQLNPGMGKIAKCDGCMDRVTRGLEPACVAACPTQAIAFATPAMKGYKTREQAALLLRRARAL